MHASLDELALRVAMDTAGEVCYSPHLKTSAGARAAKCEVRVRACGIHCAQAHQIEGDRCDNLLESRLGSPKYRRLAQLEGTDRLRVVPLDIHRNIHERFIAKLLC